MKDKQKVGDKKGLREEIRKIKKNTWFQQKADEAERYAQEKNHRELYATLNAVYGPKPRNVHPVKSKSGELLSAPEDIKERWVEHFDELLNTHTHQPIVDIVWSMGVDPGGMGGGDKSPNI